MNKLSVVVVLFTTTLFAALNANGKTENDKDMQILLLGKSEKSVYNFTKANKIGTQYSPITYSVNYNNYCNCYKVTFSNSSSKRIIVSYRYKGSFGQMTNGSAIINGNSNKEAAAGSDGQVYDVEWEYADE